MCGVPLLRRVVSSGVWCACHQTAENLSSVVQWNAECLGTCLIFSGMEAKPEWVFNTLRWCLKLGCTGQSAMGCEDKLRHSARVVLNVLVFILLQLKTKLLKLLFYGGLTEEIQLKLHWVSAEGKNNTRANHFLVE